MSRGGSCRQYLLLYVSITPSPLYDLFNDTVKNNIRFGKEEVTEDEIIAVAKKARCFTKDT